MTTTANRAPQTLGVAIKNKASITGNWKVLALSTAAFAATFIGAPGLFASMAIEKHKNSEVAKDQRTELAKHFREQVAAQLKMDNPAAVTERDLRKAAEINPQFAQLTRKIQLEEDRANRAAIAATGVGLAAGGWAPGVSAVSNVVGQVAAPMIMHVGGAITGGLASGLLNKDQLYTQDIVEHINAKTTQRAAVDPYDIMLLRISQDTALQDQIRKQGGKPFHQMNEAEQRMVTAALPELYQTAEADAEAFNAGRIKEQDLLVSSPGMNQIAVPQQQQQPAWTQRVGQRQARTGSWTQGVDASRANVPAGLVRT